MNLQTIIRLFLVAALCVSQLAAQVHVVGHFTVDDHAAHHCDTNAHEAECLFGKLAHHDEHHDENPDSQVVHNDCAIYHSYLSISLCLSAISNIAVSSVQNTTVTSFNSLIVSQLATLNYAIRAPPLNA